MRKPLLVEIAAPSGPEHYWREIRARRKGFTIPDIALCSDGVCYTTVKRYVWWLEKNDFVVRIGQRKSGYATQTLYALKTDRREAPIERAKEPSPTGRQAMWTAMRTLAQFTVAELAACASTDERPVSARAAHLYVQRLVDAGALQVLRKPARANGRPLGATSGLYRLAKSADTGPEAPKLLNASLVFDPNRRRILGDAVVSELRS